MILENELWMRLSVQIGKPQGGRAAGGGTAATTRGDETAGSTDSESKSGVRELLGSTLKPLVWPRACMGGHAEVLAILPYLLYI